MQKLDEPFRHNDIFDNLSFFHSSDLSFENKRFFCSFWLIFCPLIRIRGSAYFCEFGSKTKNVADPTDMDLEKFFLAFSKKMAG